MVRRIGRWAPSAVLFLMAVATAPGSAACTLPELRTDERPDPPGVPTKVRTSFVVADLLSVNDARQQLDLDLIATFTWRDPRLAGLDGCRFNISKVWFPQVNILNSSNLRLELRNEREQVAVGDDGQVTYRNRVAGLVSTYHNLSRFPFDRHDFEIEFAVIEFDSDAVQLVADSGNTWIADRLSIEGWIVEGVSLSSAPNFLRRADGEVSIATLIVSAARNPDYYLYRMMLLLVFVVAVTWAIFWVPPSRFEFQIGIGATSMLTAIAFSLAIAQSLPQLGYLTILDKWLIWAVFLVFLSIVEALATGLMVLSDRRAGALRLDKYSRVVFPVLLFGGWAVIALTS